MPAHKVPRNNRVYRAGLAAAKVRRKILALAARYSISRPQFHAVGVAHHARHTCTTGKAKHAALGAGSVRVVEHLPRRPKRVGGAATAAEQTQSRVRWLAKAAKQAVAPATAVVRRATRRGGRCHFSRCVRASSNDADVLLLLANAHRDDAAMPR